MPEQSDFTIEAYGIVTDPEPPDDDSEPCDEEEVD
jgi:hypothetical protein